MSGEYESARRVTYDCGEIGLAQFVPVCVTCSRFVTQNETIRVSEVGGVSAAPNAICKKCGPTHMLFEGFF